MAKFDFTGGSTKPHSWVADENAWNISNIPVPTPPLQPLPIPKQSTWDKVKAFDFRGLDINPRQIATQLGQGLSHGLSQTGSAKQDINMANLLTKNKLPFMADIGNKQVASQQLQHDYLKANPVNSIAATIGEQLPQIPLWMAGQLGVSTVGKGISKLAPSFASSAQKAGGKLPGIVKGGLKDAATYGTVVAPVDSIRKGENFEQFLDREKQLPGVFLGGAGVRGAGQVIGKGLQGVKGMFSPRGVPSAPTQPSPLPTPSPRFTGPIQTPIQAPRIQQPLQGGPLNRFQVRADSRTPGTAIPRSNAPVAERAIAQPVVSRNVIPDTPEPILNERRFAQNVRDSQVAPEGVKQNTLDNPMTYEPITNKGTLDKANMEVATDAVKARQKFNAPSKGISADDVALGESLIVKAIKDGDTVTANEIIADLAEKLTTAGQAIQAASIFKRLSPEGMLLYAQRTVNTVNKDLVNKLGLKAKKVLLTSEDSKFIIDTMTAAQKLPDGREKEIAMGKVMQLIANKVPATLSDKLKGLQRISLLLNPKTMTRNILGNAIFAGVDNVSNVIATPLDKLVGTISGKRTATLPSIGGQFKSGIRGVKETLQDAKHGIDTYSGKTQYELPSGRTFDTKIMHGLDQATKVGLQLGDRPFYNAAYDDVLRQQMKLAKTDKPTQIMIDQAHKIAQQRTYQDVNFFTDMFKLAQQALNGGRSIGLGNVVLPFVKTPANILARAVEYSPLGVANALKEATKIGRGKFDQRAFVDSISRSVTGTAIIMVGYDLAKRGIITGSGNKDKDVAAFERGLGKEDFAFKVDDNYYTYSWAQPASMALAVGADIYLGGNDRKKAENVVVDAIKSGGETIYKQSVMQGLQRFMGGYNPMDNLASTAINAPTQLTPTFSNQLGQYTDPTQRSTYSPTNLGTGANLLKARIPGLNKTLEPKVNTSGEIVQRNQGNNNLFNIFVNPGTATTFKPNEVQKEILRVYEATGDKTIFPRVAPKSITTRGETITLTPKELTEFQQTLGKTTEARMKSIIGYKEDDEKKAKELAKAIEKAYDDAKQNLLLSRGKKIE